MDLPSRTFFRPVFMLCLVFPPPRLRLLTKRTRREVFSRRIFKEAGIFVTFVKKSAMTELVLKIQRESDLKELLPVLNRLKIKYVSRKKKRKPSLKEIEEAVRIIRAGADFSYLGDPVEWQREQRKDRNLPFYHSSEH